MLKLSQLARAGAMVLAVVLAVAPAGDSLAARLVGPVAATRPAAAATGSTAANANDSTPLDKYLDSLKTLRASFLQTLTDSQGQEIDRATGTLVVERPGRFSWDTHPQPGDGKSDAGDTNKGAGQLMVSDGRNLWFFDRDLEQVNVKPVDAALSATPAMLLSGTVDVRKNFTVQAAGQRDGLEWVLVEPRGADADFRDALFGFANGDLKRMILEDKLGQTATISFDHIERNGRVAREETTFTPPKGADVIGTPRK
jgi:chaperone LolA